MYIKKVKKTNGRSKKKYQYLHLVESIRTENGPRQKLILNLGNINLDPSLYQSLAKRIEDILTGQTSMFSKNQKIDKIAKGAARKIFQKQAKEINEEKVFDVKPVDVNSLEVSFPRSLGPEYVCHSIWNELKINDCLLVNGISNYAIPLIKALVIGRLIEPASELHTREWVENRSALYEFTGEPLRASLNSYYRAGDKLFSVKEALEKHLSKAEKDIFSLKDSLFFFDLTNSYFEGACANNKKAKYGKSKEKRSDCKLVTLGMIIDEAGFCKYSELFPGNQYEGKTLLGMIEKLDKHIERESERTIVMDAGIATEGNLKDLDEREYKYIAVNRGKAPFEKDFSNMKVLNKDKTNRTKIEVKRFETNEEVYILVRSSGKKKKEESIRGRIEQLFLERLLYYKSGLVKKGRIKKYERILESIGRLKEKYSKAAKLYEIEVIPEGNDKKNAKDIIWKKKEEKYKNELEYEGSYVLRTNRLDLSDDEIWNIYIMLGNIEEAFLNMKSHLGLRPNFHQLENRVDTHMFISVIAYHILNFIEKKLKLSGDKRRWHTIRDILKTHQRITIEYNERLEDGSFKKRQIRKNTKLELEHLKIYRYLELSGKPLQIRKL